MTRSYGSPPTSELPDTLPGGAVGIWPAHHETLLTQHPEKYAEVVESVTAFGILMIDRSGFIQSWNQGAAQITGFAADEVIGQKYDLLFPPDAVHEGRPRRTLEFVRTNLHSKDEQRRRLRKGGEFLAQTSLDAVRSPSGELYGFVEVFQDVTASREREEHQYRRATRDALTGLINHNHFNEMAKLEFERARRFSEPLSLVRLEVDHFERLVANYGAEFCDRILASTASCCLNSGRKIDLMARIGENEFALLLPRANKQPAVEFAQRLRVMIGKQRLAVGTGREIGFTVTLGVASLRPTTRDFGEMLRNADVALYSARRHGRNCVEAWFE